MNKKGFTLVELLGVVVIIALLSFLIVPRVINVFSNKKEDISKVNKDIIVAAAKLYVSENKDNYEEGNSNVYCIALATLNEEDYLGDNLKEIISNQAILNSKTVKIEYKKSFKYSIVDNNECLESYVSKPVLHEGMTPVVYDGDNWKVVKESDEWYNYSEQWWANVVVLNQGVSKKDGDTLDINSEVNSMFVWIPKYEYKIEGTYGTHTDGTLGTQEQPGEIKVKFIPKKRKTADEGYHIHPAFTFGKEKLSGIWVGKFETTGTADNPTILPDEKTLRGYRIANQFLISQEFNNYIEGADSHLSKNSEWGAIAYLSQSLYGKYGNDDYVGPNKEVYINDSSAHYTGRSSGAPSGVNKIKDVYTEENNDSLYNKNGFYSYDGYLLEYDTNNKSSIKDLTKVSSTTGNIYGIYDMSGGDAERVMAVLADDNGNPRTGYITGNSSAHFSGFNGTLADGTLYTGGTDFPKMKYYDLYTSTDITKACGGNICYGHALSETRGWYDDKFSFTSINSPWIARGYMSDCSTNKTCGVFYSGTNKGGWWYVGDDKVGYVFRVVLK